MDGQGNRLAGTGAQTDRDKNREEGHRRTVTGTQTDRHRNRRTGTQTDRDRDTKGQRKGHKWTRTGIRSRT
jgi:hypothetical protein